MKSVQSQLASIYKHLNYVVRGCCTPTSTFLGDCHRKTKDCQGTLNRLKDVVSEKKKSTFLERKALYEQQQAALRVLKSFSAQIGGFHDGIRSLAAVIQSIGAPFSPMDEDICC